LVTAEKSALVYEGESTLIELSDFAQYVIQLIT
ncbi:unnamed protein product, partial [Rotaria magnacalcarata]